LWNESAAIDANRCDLAVLKEVFMAATASNLSLEGRSGDSGFPEPRLLSTNEAQPGLYHLHLDESREEDWYLDEEDFRSLFEKTLTIATATGTRWLVVDDPVNAGRFAAALGFFFYGGVCRLQEVITDQAHRKNGLATKLIRAVAARAVESGCDKVALLADPESSAHLLYSRLGFSDLAVEVTLMKY
jgi:GNAT superfamily N-acetyltransferase